MNPLLSALLCATLLLGGSSGAAQPEPISDDPLMLLTESNDYENFGISQLPLEIRIEAVDYAEGFLLLRIQNESGYPMIVDSTLTLAYKNGENWEELQPNTPVENGNSFEMQDLETIVTDVNLTPYAPLAAGTYRLTYGDLSTEFTLMEK